MKPVRVADMVHQGSNQSTSFVHFFLFLSWENYSSLVRMVYPLYRFSTNFTFKENDDKYFCFRNIYFEPRVYRKSSL
uniref:Uncharacterized protein n=1 Tax=Solanum lycopersicum TaxID=4081 RepID=A0A3Q7EF56_SOLLC